ncbi:MAG: PHP domain-containing protein [bacterium]
MAHIDLHVHSSFSDGSCSPQELIDLALKSELSALALCDHDTTTGLKIFQDYGKAAGLSVISGVEISATWEKGNCHILGLGIKPGHEQLEAALLQIRQGRDSRNEVILDKLKKLDVHVSLDEVRQIAGKEVIARPHIAQIMVNKGYTASVQEAFDRFLAKGSPAYFNRFRLEPAAAVSILDQAGGVAVLAHPSQLKLDAAGLDAFVRELIPHGLKGLEVFTPYSSDNEIADFINIADKYSLVKTGGSDFHGHCKPVHDLGFYGKDKPIPRGCLDELEKALDY